MCVYVCVCFGELCSITLLGLAEVFTQSIMWTLNIKNKLFD